MKKPLLLSTYVDGSLDTDHYGGMINDHSSRHQFYAEKWGYERVVTRVGLDDMNGGWFRIKVILKALKENKYSHVFFLDADVIIANLGVDLRKSLPKGFFLAMTVYPLHWYDIVHYQTGVMFIRSCQKAIDFFEAVLAMRGHQIDIHKDDQWVINYLLISQPEQWQLGLRHLIFPWNQIGEPEGSHEPIIAAWHGCGSPEERRQIMQNWALKPENFFPGLRCV